MSHRDDIHPDWCGLGHVCSHDRPAGEHRSHPVTVDTNTARLVVTRIRTRGGRDRIELRVVVDLPRDPGRAQTAARQVAFQVHRAVSRASVSGGGR
jgi:hypothetical protein